MRIAIVTTHPPGLGSLNEYAFHFVRYLRRKDDVSEIILLADELPSDNAYAFPDSDPEWDGTLAPVNIRPCWRFGAIGNAWRVRSAVREAAPDVVLFNLQFATFGDSKAAAAIGLTAPALVRASGVPTVVLLHNIMETVDLSSAGFAGNPLVDGLIRLFGNVATRLLLRADLVTITIEKYHEILTEKYGAQNVALAPHGSFEEPVEPNYKLPPGPLQIMTFGKFGTYKKVEALVEAFVRLQSGEHPPLELVIAGGNSPNAQGYLEGVRRRYADVENVRFTGYVPEEDVPRIFRESAVVVFPYTSTTGSSGVLHQAGDYGKAVVLPDIGDLGRLVAQEGFDGVFFEPDDAESLADAIGRLIDDPTLRNTIGERNFRAASGLPISEVVDWYLFHFDELLQAGSGTGKE